METIRTSRATIDALSGTRKWGNGMIVTHENYEVRSVGRLMSPGERLWRAVSLEVRMVYFLIRFTSTVGPSLLTETLMIWREDDVIDFCRDTLADVTCRVLDVSRISPPTDGSNMWQVLPVSEIWEGSNEYGHSTIVIVLANGTRMQGRDPQGSEPSIEGLTRVF